MDQFTKAIISLGLALTLTEKSYRLCQKCWITNCFSPWGLVHLVWLSVSSRSRALIIVVLDCSLASPTAPQRSSGAFPSRDTKSQPKPPNGCLWGPGGGLIPCLNTQLKPHCNATNEIIMWCESLTDIWSKLCLYITSKLLLWCSKPNKSWRIALTDIIWTSRPASRPLLILLCTWSLRWL